MFVNGRGEVAWAKRGGKTWGRAGGAGCGQCRSNTRAGVRETITHGAGGVVVASSRRALKDAANKRARLIPRGERGGKSELAELNSAGNSQGRAGRGAGATVRRFTPYGVSLIRI